MTADFTVRADAPGRPFKPLHGVTGGPWVMAGCWDLSDRFREMHTPVVRLHDCHYSDPESVDIHCIFPDWEADPDDPASYRFERTDDHLLALHKLGVEIIYRLGESIEHGVKKFWVNPPPDPAKWGSVCAHILRHYNQGWADGFHWGIRRWEVWNEPDCDRCWTGNLQQYLELYEHSARALKAADPQALVGGPALAYQWDQARAFLAFCRQRELPLDFFSWHAYGDRPATILEKVGRGFDLLTDCGYEGIETHLTEWNRVTSFSLEPLEAREVYKHTTGIGGAACTASTLAYLQDTDLDFACYCSAVGGIGRICMFDRHQAPHKSFHAFQAFGHLAARGRRLPANGSNPDSGLAIAAAADDRGLSILLSNFADARDRFTLAVTGLPHAGPWCCREAVLDADRDLVFARDQVLSGDSFRITVDLPAPSVRLLDLVPAAIA